MGEGQRGLGRATDLFDGHGEFLQVAGRLQAAQGNPIQADLNWFGQGINCRQSRW